jgi:hypothetical protein
MPVLEVVPPPHLLPALLPMRKEEAGEEGRDRVKVEGLTSMMSCHWDLPMRAWPPSMLQ